jgi:hypothetical protein
MVLKYHVTNHVNTLLQVLNVLFTICDLKNCFAHLCYNGYDFIQSHCVYYLLYLIVENN